MIQRSTSNTYKSYQSRPSTSLKPWITNSGQWGPHVWIGGFTRHRTATGVQYRHSFHIWSGLSSQTLDLDRTYWALAFVCLYFFFLYIFLFLVTCARLSWPHSVFQSTLNYLIVISYCVVRYCISA